MNSRRYALLALLAIVVLICVSIANGWVAL